MKIYENIKKGFIRFLLSQYGEYLKFGIIEPEIVKGWRLEYFDASNKTKHWFNEYLQPCESGNEKYNRLCIPTEVFPNFCAISSGTKKISKSTFTSQLTEFLGKVSSKSLQKGIYTDGGVAYIQGYEWKAKDDTNGGCLLKLEKPVLKKLNDLDLDVETEDEGEPEYELE
jgi:hypothetical protein